MVSIGTIIAATIIMGAIFLRRQIGEAGTMIGSGAGELGLGLQTLFASILSPQIRPSFFPSIGLLTDFPDIPSLGDLTRPDKPRPDENCREVSVFSICSPSESSRGFPGISKFCCPRQEDETRNGAREYREEEIGYRSFTDPYFGTRQEFVTRAAPTIPIGGAGGFGLSSIITREIEEELAAERRGAVSGFL